MGMSSNAIDISNNNLQRPYNKSSISKDMGVTEDNIPAQFERQGENDITQISHAPTIDPPVHYLYTHIHTPQKHRLRTIYTYKSTPQKVSHMICIILHISSMHQENYIMNMKQAYIFFLIFIHNRSLHAPFALSSF